MDLSSKTAISRGKPRAAPHTSSEDPPHPAPQGARSSSQEDSGHPKRRQEQQINVVVKSECLPQYFTPPSPELHASMRIILMIAPFISPEREPGLPN